MVFLFQRSRLFIFYHLTFSSDFLYLFFFALYPFLSISSSLLCIRVPLVISLLVFLCLIACNALSSYIMLSFSLLRTFFFLASIALHFFFTLVFLIQSFSSLSVPHPASLLKHLFVCLVLLVRVPLMPLVTAGVPPSPFLVTLRVPVVASLVPSCNAFEPQFLLPSPFPLSPTVCLSVSICVSLSSSLLSLSVCFPLSSSPSIHTTRCAFQFIQVLHCIPPILLRHV